MERSRNFEMKNLSEGMFVKTRAGFTFVKVVDQFIGAESSMSLWEFKSNLTHKENRDFDIVEVLNIKPGVKQPVGLIGLNEYPDKFLRTIWKREIAQVHISDAAKILSDIMGIDVEIVDEDEPIISDEVEDVNIEVVLDEISKIFGFQIG